MTSWAPTVERWRPFALKYLPSVPVDFILAWIKRESGGRITKPTSLNERGILQVHPDEATDMGLSSAEFNQLLVMEDSPSYNAAEHFRISAKLVFYKQKVAETYAKRYGLNWTGSSFWTYVKLIHGLPAIASKGMAAFVDALKRPPVSFAEFATWLRAKRWAYAGWDADRVSKILANAEDTGKWATGAGAGVGTLVLLGLFIAWLTKAFR
jgi:hypothetical protein